MSYVQVIGGGTAEGGGPSLLLFFDEHRYLFGCGEGTQRACCQHQVRLSRLRAVFLSCLEWTHSGGLPGMICTVADSGGVTNVQLVGPPGTIYLIASLRAFLRRSHLALGITEALGDTRSEQPQQEQEQEQEKDEGEKKEENISESKSRKTGRTTEKRRIIEGDHQTRQATSTSNTPSSLEPPSQEDASINNMALKLPVVYEDQMIRVRALEIRRVSQVEHPLVGGKRPRIEGIDQRSSKVHLDNIQIHDEGRQARSKCHHQVILTMFKSPLSDNRPGPVQADEQYEGVSHPEHQHQHPCSPDSNEARLRDATPLPPFKFTGSSLCWVVEGPGRPGKFDALRARQLGIPPGPLYGQLAQGRSVTLPDGRHIEPSQCVGTAQLGPVFVILPVERDHLLALFEAIHRLAWDRIHLVFHQCKVDVWRDPEYQRRVVKDGPFPSDTQHVWIDMGSPPQAAGDTVVDREKDLVKGVSNTYNGLDRLVLPATVELTRMLATRVSPQMFSLAPLESGSSERVKPLTRYYWYKGTVGLEDLSRLTPEEFWPLSQSTTGAISTSTASTVLPLTPMIPSSLMTTLSSPCPENPVVTFLGTAAALPGKYRNVSSTLVDWGTAALLLDCGEGTFGQLVRKFGPRDTEGILDRLTAILISHLHADHQLGVPGILARMWRRQSNRPVTLVAPSRYRLFLEELGQCAVTGADFTFIPTESLVIASEDEPTARSTSGGDKELGGDEVVSALDPFLVQAVPVIHCPYAYGYVITHRGSAIKVTFSGDTRPCERLAQAGAASHILIHEATFGDGHEQEALEKRHCTVREALEVATSMGARHTLLTHISQRYAKTCPPHNWAAESGPGRIGLPVIDFMSVSLRQLEAMDIGNMCDLLLAALPETDTDTDMEVEVGTETGGTRDDFEGTKTTAS